MTMMGKYKEWIDWARRGEFLYRMGVLALATSAGSYVRSFLMSQPQIPPIWRQPTYLLCFAVVLILFARVLRWWEFRKSLNLVQAHENSVLPDRLFSPFQIEVFSLAKELRAYLREKTSQKPAELAVPEVSQPGSLEHAQWMVDTTTQREGWRSKLRSGYKLRFADKVIRVASQAGEHGITDFRLDQLAPGIMTETDVETLISLLCHLAIRSWEMD